MGLDTVELVMDVEETFDIEIPDEDASKIRTVGDFYNVVLAKLNVAQRNADKRQVWEKLKERIAYIGGVAPERIVPDAKIVKDLGIN